MKPSKCRSFSIQKGQPTITYFNIGENRAPSVQEEEQKFLGKLVFFNGKSSETYEHIKTKLNTKMDYVNTTKIRDEYKIWIYKHYITSSIRFILTIPELNKTDLIKPDNLTHRCIKKWAGLPRWATNSIFHLQTALNIPSISQIYNESHLLTYADAKMKGDFMVNHVLDQKLDRERKMTRKNSIIVDAARALEETAAKNPNLFEEREKKLGDESNAQPLQYCICRGEDEGDLMIGCDYCKEWYHPR
mgnify:CR=1 FL=1